MSELHNKCTRDGLDMILSLSYKLYDAQMGAFLALDSKAGNLIGYVAVAASVLGLSAVGRTPVANVAPPHPQYLLAGVFLSFLLAIIAAIAVLMPRGIAGPPSAVTAINYWKENGDFKNVDAVVEGMENAQKRVADANISKIRLLTAAFVLVGIGFLCIALLSLSRAC